MADNEYENRQLELGNQFQELLRRDSGGYIRRNVDTTSSPFFRYKPGQYLELTGRLDKGNTYIFLINGEEAITIFYLEIPTATLSFLSRRRSADLSQIRAYVDLSLEEPRIYVSGPNPHRQRKPSLPASPKTQRKAG